MTIKPNYKVSKTETGATIHIDLPGVKKEDIKQLSDQAIHLIQTGETSVEEVFALLSNK